MTAPADRQASARRPGAPIPITVLTGFLGAGKTSLLNRLLAEEALADAAVLINEFGEIGIDHLLVREVRDGIVMLTSGCLCCTVRGDLVDALESLLRDLDNHRLAFGRVVLETTGLADPAPVLQTLMTHPYLVMRLRLDGVVAVVDAVNGFSTLDAHPESVKQAAVADRIALTKTDLADTPERKAATAALIARLRGLNPAAPILDVASGEATAGSLLNCGLYEPGGKIPDVARWLKEEAYADAASLHGHGHAHDHGHDFNRHDDHIRAFCLAGDAAIPAATFDMFLDLIRSLHGPHLLRVKGVVKIAETPDAPVVIHGVQHVFHPPAALPVWPDDDRRTRLVFIVRDLDPKVIRELFGAFIGVAAPDRPDRAALTDNPLAPFGGLAPR
jgi:G3E family GTPase